jgi:hypothetical protein
VRCGRRLRFDASHRRNRKYCRPCAKAAKRERDRQHKQAYRDTGLGREQRKRENRRTRDRLGWTDYMRFWRKADSYKTAARERARARRYYEAHRAEICARRRARRVAEKPAEKARSH